METQTALIRQVLYCASNSTPQVTHTVWLFKSQAPSEEYGAYHATLLHSGTCSDRNLVVVDRICIDLRSRGFDGPRTVEGETRLPWPPLWQEKTDRNSHRNRYPSEDD